MHLEGKALGTIERGAIADLVAYRLDTITFTQLNDSLHKGGDGMFTIDELIEAIPGSLMNGIVPVVPPVKMSEAVKSGDVKKAG